MPNHPLDPFLLSVFENVSVQKIFPSLRSTEFMNSIDMRLALNTGQSFVKSIDIESISPGLTLDDRMVTLSEDWGVKLSASLHPFIDVPVNVRTRNDLVFVANGSAVEDSTTACSILDSNLNYVGPVGKKGTDLTSGEYAQAVDFALDGNPNGKKYYIVSTVDNIVHYYNQTTLVYEGSIGDGTPGVNGTRITAPVAIAIGTSQNYVLCSSGTAAGATGPGFLAVYGTDTTFKSIPLFHGKNGGNGRCIEGEITAPKDMVVVSTSGKDNIYILNGTDEVGKFIWNGTTFILDTVYNIPSNFSASSLGLSRIAINGNVLYITASNIGKIIAIDLTTKKLIGSFGNLRAEITGESIGTLGYFNGLAGIAFIGDKIVVTESLNNRVQVFGKSLLADTTMNITFDAVNIPSDKKLIDIAYSLTGDVIPDIVIVDQRTGQEFDIKTAKARNINFFKVRLKLNPHLFSVKKNQFDIYPIYVLMEM